MNDESAFAPIDEPLRKKFEKAWNSGQPLPIESCLPPQSQPTYLATLEELVHIELEYAWRSPKPATSASARPLVEDYIDRFSELTEPSRLRRLVQQEYRVRHLFGDQPRAEEYCRRFPEAITSADELSAPTSMRNTSPGEAPRLEKSIGPYRLLQKIGEGGFRRGLYGRADAARSPTRRHEGHQTRYG